jgi:hypothetical protein
MDPIIAEMLRGGGVVAFAAFLAWQNHSLFSRVVEALEKSASASEKLAGQIERALDRGGSHGR